MFRGQRGLKTAQDNEKVVRSRVGISERWVGAITPSLGGASNASRVGGVPCSGAWL